MTKWTLRYCTDLEKWLDKLNHIHFKSLAKELKLLELSGNNLRLPHSRSLGAGLFELREREYGYRIYYSFMPNLSIVMLHAGTKTSQKKDIITARKRLMLLKLDERRFQYEN